MNYIKVCFIIIAFSGVVIFLQHRYIRRLLGRVNSLKPRYKLSRYEFSKLDFNNVSLKTLDSLSGIQFEDLCCELLSVLGYSKISKTRTTGDFGLDIICERDGKRYGIQCKCYNGSVGVDAVQQAFSGCAYYRCDVPVVMSNMYFTDAAQELARVIGVTIWSRHFFLEKIGELQHNKKVMHDLKVR